MIDPPASYLAAHRYDGAAIEHGRRHRLESCAVQPRDVAIVHDVSRLKYLTASQVHELWWSGASVQAADRRLLKLFRAGLLERFRPVARRGEGSFPWTYVLGEEGHRLLQHSGLIEEHRRYRRRLVYDFGHVLHEIQLNAWVLAYRRALDGQLRSWQGETTFAPPAGARQADRLADDWSVEGLRDARARSVCPDAIVETGPDRESERPQTFFIEYDRTRRLDKNFDKFHRYDGFLNWWWRRTHLVEHGASPFVVFVCQDDEQRDKFLAAADRELTGHRWHPDVTPDRFDYAGRKRILFASELDAHRGLLEAWRLPGFPSGHPARSPDVRRVRIGPTQRRAAPA